MFLRQYRFLSIYRVFLFSLFSVLLSCGPLPVNPNNVNNADISITLTSSSGIKHESLIFDTLGRDIELKIACKLPEFIDSVRVQILEANKTISVDTILKFVSNLKYDTLMLKFTIRTYGDKNIDVIGYRENKTMVSCTGMIKVFESVKTNTKPQITVSGVKSIIPGEKCTLTVAINDPDSGQTHIISALNNGKNSTLMNNKYTVISDSNFVGNDTIIFTVTDNGTPILSSSITVIIPVSSVKPSVPLAPNNLQISNQTKSTAILTWEKSLNANNYAVYRSTFIDKNFVKIKDSIIDSIFTDSITDIVFYYYVTATNEAGESAKSIIVSTGKIIEKPIITTQPEDQSALVGSIAVFSLVVTGVDTKYQWKKNGIDISGATSSSYTVTSVTTADDGSQYRCIVTNSGGTVTSSTAMLTVKYLLKYNGNNSTGGTVPHDNSTYAKGTSVKISADIPTKTGFTFVGWNIAADGSGTKTYAAGDTMITGTSDITLYAKWSALSFIITFDKNSTSASGAMNTLTIANGTTAKLTDNTFSNPGFTFLGWATASTGTVTYIDGTNFTMGAYNVTLYAVWSVLPKYTVTYNGNGNTDGTVPAGDGYFENSTVNVASNTGALTKAGYSFKGWNTKADGSGIAYDTATTFKIGAAAVTLYAQWKIETFKITYNNMDGVTNVNPVTYTIEQTPILLTNPAKNEYTFGGWYDNSSLSGIKVTSIAAGIIGNLNLFAKWSINTYTVTYNGNNNTSGAAPLTKGHGYGTDVTVEDNTGSLTRTGCIFSGWNSAPNGTGTDFIIGSKITITKDTILYAKWTSLPKYTVTYMPNGDQITGTVPDTKQYLEKEIVTASVNTGNLARKGYVLAAWNTKVDGTGTDYSLGTGTFSMAATNQNLYARWEIRDASGNVYHEIKIGNQVWMAENLRTTNYNDGTPILAWNSSTVQTDGRFYAGDEIYGSYYNGDAVGTGKLAPDGWKVPTVDDWDKLIAIVANDARSLAAKVFWGMSIDEGDVGYDKTQNDSTGFSAIPSGEYNGTTTNYLNSRALFWTSKIGPEEGINTGWFYYIDSNENGINNDWKSTYSRGLSVRCLRDY